MREVYIRILDTLILLFSNLEIVHRNVKPRRIICFADTASPCHPKLTDFGKVRRTPREMAAMAFGGTLGFLSQCIVEKLSGGTRWMDWGRTVDVYGIVVSIHGILSVPHPPHPTVGKRHIVQE